MELEMEVHDEVNAACERLNAAATVLEQVAERLGGLQIAAAPTREAELEQRLAEAQATIVSLQGQGRKTFAVGSLVAKESVAIEAGALDVALSSLSIEQRIAVKSQLLRSGWLG